MNFYILTSTIFSLILAENNKDVIVRQIIIENPQGFCNAITSTGPVEFNFEKCDTILIEYEADWKTFAEFNLEKSKISILNPFKLFNIKLLLEHEDFVKKTFEVHGNVEITFGSCEKTSVWLINVLDQVWKSVDIVNPAKLDSVGQIKIENPQLSFDTNRMSFNVGTGTNTQMVIKKAHEYWMINVINGTVDLKGNFLQKERGFAPLPVIDMKDVKFTFIADDNTKVVVSSNLCPGNV